MMDNNSSRYHKVVDSKFALFISQVMVIGISVLVLDLLYVECYFLHCLYQLQDGTNGEVKNKAWSYTQIIYAGAERNT